MKTIEVVAAIIVKEGKVLATQRGYGAFKGKWEFPGGKIEPKENAERALVREIKEELDCEITIGELLQTVEYDYPEFHLKMNCYLCELKDGYFTLKVHEAAKWLKKEELDSVYWLPADKSIIYMIRDRL